MRKFANLISGTLSADLVTSGTTLSSAILASVPEIISPDEFVIVIDPEDAGAFSPEVVYVTAHTAGATTATVTRAREGTADPGASWPSGTKIIGAVSKAFFEAAETAIADVATAKAVTDELSANQSHVLAEVTETFQGSSALTSNSLADVGQPVTITLPTGWDAMDVLVHCRIRMEQPGSSGMLFLFHVSLDGVAGETNPLTIENYRASGSGQHVKATAAKLNATASVTAQARYQLPIGAAPNGTGLVWYITKFRRWV